jgi:hypothetical protein
MDAKKIIIDRLDSALRHRGVKLKRAALLETAAQAFGHHSSNEFGAATKRGDYDATAIAAMEADAETVAQPRTGPDGREGRRGGIVADIPIAISALEDGDLVYMTSGACEVARVTPEQLDALRLPYGSFDGDFYPLTDEEAGYVSDDLMPSSDGAVAALLGYSVLYLDRKHLAPTIEFDHEGSGQEGDLPSQAQALADATLYAHSLMRAVKALRGDVLVDPRGDGLGRVEVTVLIPIESAMAIGSPDIWRACLAELLSARTDRFRIGDGVAAAPSRTNLCVEVEMPRTDRYAAYDGSGRLLAEGSDLEEVKTSCNDDDGRYDLESHVVDRTDKTVMQAKYCWRPESLVDVEFEKGSSPDMAARILIQRQTIETLRNNLESEIRMGPDWRSWEKDLKKASHKRQEPIDDETLYRFRHAVADNHSKSSSGERSTVEYREARFVSKHLGGLLARLDRAEEAMRIAGIAPAEISRKSRKDAEERLAAIEAVRPSRSKETGLWRVLATQDGSVFDEIVEGVDEHDAGQKARELCGAAFRMDVDAFRDPEEDGEPGYIDEMDFDCECDSFHIEAVDMPDAVGIISDAMSLLSSSSFQHGMPLDHPARLKLFAARDLLVPKKTV